MMLDYLIIGQGISGTNLAWTLYQQGNSSFQILDQPKVFAASTAAEGLMNPITGRRYVKSWMFDTLFENAFEFYGAVDQILGTRHLHQIAIFRFLKSVKDQNDWLQKSSDPAYAPYLDDTNIAHLDGDYADQVFGGFRIAKAGKLEVKPYLEASRAFFKEKNLLIEADFVPEKLEPKSDSIRYQDLQARHLICCEGYGVSQNPWFSWLPIIGNKGQALSIQTNMPHREVLVGKKTLAPMANGHFWLGATFENDFDQIAPTPEAEAQLCTAFEQQFKLPYEIVDRISGIRPTVPDRRPIIGRHPAHPNLLIFNGMGTKGVSLSPYFTKALVQYLQQKAALDQAVQIERFYHLYPNETA
jgi:glycine/D-amino acid oxidase-like deaminating enzyme